MSYDSSIIKVKAQSLTGVTFVFTCLLAILILFFIMLVTDVGLIFLFIFTIVIIAPLVMVLFYIVNLQTKNVGYTFSKSSIIISSAKEDKQLLFKDVSKIYWHRNGASVCITSSVKTKRYSLFLGKDTANTYSYLDSVIPDKLIVSNHIFKLWENKGTTVEKSRNSVCK